MSKKKFERIFFKTFFKSPFWLLPAPIDLQIRDLQENLLHKYSNNMLYRCSFLANFRPFEQKILTYSFNCVIFGNFGHFVTHKKSLRVTAQLWNPKYENIKIWYNISGTIVYKFWESTVKIQCVNFQLLAKICQFWPIWAIFWSSRVLTLKSPVRVT